VVTLVLKCLAIGYKISNNFSLSLSHECRSCVGVDWRRYKSWVENLLGITSGMLRAGGEFRWLSLFRVLLGNYSNQHKISVATMEIIWLAILDNNFYHGNSVIEVYCEITQCSLQLHPLALKLNISIFKFQQPNKKSSNYSWYLHASETSEFNNAICKSWFNVAF